MSNECASVKSIIKILDEALSSMQNFPHGVLYESLCRQKAMLLLEDGKEDEAIAYMTESFGVTVRQRFIFEANEQRRLAHPGKLSKEQKADASMSGLQQHLIEFGGSLAADAPLGHHTRLATLPSEWTVVQLCELDCGPSQCPPRSSPDRPKPLLLCRLGCGSRAGHSELRLRHGPVPLPYCRDQDLIAELQSIIQDNANILTIGAKSEFWRRKKVINERFEVVVTALREWLAEDRSLLLGRIVDPALEAAVEKGAATFAKTFKVPQSSLPSLVLLMQASSLSDSELRQGLVSLLPTCGKQQLDVAAATVRKFSKSVMGERKESLAFTPRHHVVLILDKTLYGLPWEMLDVLRRQPVSRVPCLSLLHAMHAAPQARKQLDAKSAFFVVDPDNNLNATAKRIQPLMLARHWSGTVSKAPSKVEVEQALREQDIYLYCGHGAGMHLLPDKVQCNSVAILIGCSSSMVSKLGPNWEMHGAPIKFLLSGSPATLGMLWDVLDRDSDKMTIHLLEKWLPLGSQEIVNKYRKQLCQDDLSYNSLFRDLDQPCKELLNALWAARNASESSFIAAAFVANGLPMSVHPDTEQKQ